jgi:hypothetical protein
MNPAFRIKAGPPPTLIDFRLKPSLLFVIPQGGAGPEADGLLTGVQSLPGAGTVGAKSGGHDASVSFRTGAIRKYGNGFAQRPIIMVIAFIRLFGFVLWRPSF